MSQKEALAAMIRPDINITPLIDVLLVLLIIFMIITPERSASMSASVPSESKDIERIDPNPLTLIVTVGTDSSLTLNSTSLDATISSPEAMIELLNKTFADRVLDMSSPVTDASTEHVERTVFIKAPQSLDYGSVAKVVDAVRDAGARPVSLQLDRLDQ